VVGGSATVYGNHPRCADGCVVVLASVCDSETGRELAGWRETQIKDSEAARQQLEADLDGAEKFSQSLTDQLNAKQKEFDTTTADLKAQIKDSEAARQQLEADLTGAEKFSQSLTDQLNAKQKEFDSATTELKAQLKDSEATRQQLEADLAGAEKFADSLATQVNAKQAEMDELGKERKSLSNQNQELQVALTDMRENANAQTLSAERTDRGLLVKLSGDVSFDVGSAELRANALPLLDSIATFLEDNPERKLMVEGHTDSTGSEENNLTLSQNRAEAVRAYFAAKGIAVERIEIQGYGAATPIASNDTSEGRRQNRRVDIIILTPGA
jgi:outer membrane protein OmpA-like peptidoglycan-associated protein